MSDAVSVSNVQPSIAIHCFVLAAGRSPASLTQLRGGANSPWAARRCAGSLDLPSDQHCWDLGPGGGNPRIPCHGTLLVSLSHRWWMDVFITSQHGKISIPSPRWNNQCRDRSIAPRSPGYFEHSLSIHGRSLHLSASEPATEVPTAARSWPRAAWPAAFDARGRSHGGSASCVMWPLQVRVPRPYWLRPWAPRSCRPACPSYLGEIRKSPPRCSIILKINTIFSNIL